MTFRITKTTPTGTTVNHMITTECIKTKGGIIICATVTRLSSISHSCTVTKYYDESVTYLELEASLNKLTSLDDGIFNMVSDYCKDQKKENEE